MKTRYTVQYERDESGSWTAVIDRKQGVSCVTHGRSLNEARKRIREALALYFDGEKAAAAAELVDDVKLPPRLKGDVKRAVRVREQAQKVQTESVQLSEAVARELAAAGFSTRDAADLLGVSHQRIFQAVAGGKGKGTSNPASQQRATTKAARPVRRHG